MLEKAIDLGTAAIYTDIRKGVLHNLYLRARPEKESEIILISDSQIAQELFEYLTGARRVFSSLKLQYPPCSTFQLNVWKALEDIPFGQTKSYNQIAALADSPRAARAVGKACGRNPFPIIVPCHRVIKSDGSAGGFSSDTAWKNFLLELEGHCLHK